MMKRFVLISVLLCVAFSASAQKWQYSLGASLGAYDRAGYGGGSEIVDVPESHPHFLPTFSLEAGRILEEAPIGIFMGVFWNYAWNNLNGGPSLLKEQEHIFHFLPEVRFYYLRRDAIMLYSCLATGLRYGHYSETFEGDVISNNKFDVSYQFNPFGMCFSIHNWLINCEIGYGTAWSILKLGVGYQF